ncbi:MAG: 50S ribosomal protein L29 [Patescibacteria group bacterium]
MKKTNYTDKPRQDLLKTLMEKREILRKLRFESAGSKTRNVKSRVNTRKDIARIMTELNKNDSRKLTTSKKS